MFKFYNEFVCELKPTEALVYSVIYNDFYQECKSENYTTLTACEIGKMTGMSTDSAYDIVDRLIQKGYLKIISKTGAFRRRYQPLKDPKDFRK